MSRTDLYPLSVGLLAMSRARLPPWEVRSSKNSIVGGHQNLSGCPETASFVAERDYPSWGGRAGNRLVRSSLAAVRIGAGSDVVLACVSSSFTGFAELRKVEWC
jgi:hypothetical protein